VAELREEVDELSAELGATKARYLANKDKLGVYREKIRSFEEVSESVLYPLCHVV
jgi:hypothetical protein